MKKSIFNLGKTLNKEAQKLVKGGLRDINNYYIGSGCYYSLSRCNTAMEGAISNGVNPLSIRCVACTTSYGSAGYEARIYG